jgi:hypothetical protein
MPNRPAAAPRVFISHQGDADIRPLLEGLRDRGTDPYVLSDVAVLGSEFVEALRNAVERADLVVAVLAGERAPNAYFAAGVAYALGKPLMLIVPPGARTPSDLVGQLVVRARPDDLDAINFVLDQVARRVQSVPPAASAPSERALGPAVVAELLERLRRESQEWEAIAVLIEAIEASGAVAATNVDPDAGFDLGVWSDDLAAIGGNPLVVDLKREHSREATSQALHALAKHPTARLALLVYLLPSPDAVVAAEREMTRASYPVLAISLEELIRRMASASFAEVVRDLRNQSVHGRLPS